jgi:hypothetical protein
VSWTAAGADLLLLQVAEDARRESGAPDHAQVEVASWGLGFSTMPVMRARRPLAGFVEAMP